MEEPYSNIRNIIGELIGKRVLEITQHDPEYFERTGRSFVDLMFESGDVLRIYVHGDETAMCLNPTEEGETEIFGDPA